MYFFYRYVGLKPCISRLPENGDGTINTTWPDRLDNPPERLKGVEMDAYISKKELFKAESNYWNSIIKGYNRVFHWENMQLRNVMDMKAGFGGYIFLLFLFLVICSMLRDFAQNTFLLIKITIIFSIDQCYF